MGRCRVPGGQGRSVLESGQEAIIRSRMNRNCDPTFSSSKKKTERERKMELLELRHELAKCTSELEEQGYSFDDTPAGNEVTSFVSSPTSSRGGGRPSVFQDAGFSTAGINSSVKKGVDMQPITENAM